MNSSEVVPVLDNQAAPERLCPELMARLEPDTGQPLRFVRHPLVNAPYDGEVSAKNAFYNGKLRDMTEAVGKAKVERNWADFLFGHERPWRIDAFAEIQGELSDTEYWEWLSEIWTDTEYPHQSLGMWRRFWRAKRPGREAAMEPEERAVLAALPDRITVYRGTQFPTHTGGISWTLDPDKARWFATRFLDGGEDAYLVHGQLEKRHVLAYLDGRNEREIVALPERIKNVQIEILPVGSRLIAGPSNVLPATE